ncbi:protein CHUP1, chloroplastic [Tanacetum coccineum]
MTLYNALPRKEYERVFMCKTTKEVWHTLIITHQGNSQVKDCNIDLLTQQYKKLSISNEILSIVVSHDLMLLRAKVTTIEVAKDLATLPLDELIGNLKVYEMILENDDVASKTTKEKVKSLTLKAKVTREQTSDDSDSQGGSDENVHREEAEALNLMARNFCRDNSFGNKGGKRSRQRRGCYNCKEEGHFIGECPKPKENKAFVERAWSDSEDGDELQNDATCLMTADSQEVQPKSSISNNVLDIVELQKENEELLRFNKDFTKTFKKLLKDQRSLKSKKSKLISTINDLKIKVKKLSNVKEVVEPYDKCDVLTQDVDSLKCNISRLQDEAFNFSKFKKSSIVLDDMLSRQKLSQDKEVERGLRRRIGGPWLKIFERVEERMKRSARCGEVKGSGVVLGVAKSSLGENPGCAIGVGSGES